MRNKSILVITICLLLVVFSVTIHPKFSFAGDSKVIKLKFAGWLPPKQMLSATVDQWASEVAKRTNGRVEIATYHAQTLGKFPDLPKLVLGGVADISLMMPMSKGFDLLGVGDLPNLVSTTAAAMDVANSLYRRGKFSKFFEEKGFKPLFFMPTDPFYIFLRGKKVTSPSQLKGMKLRGATPVQIQMVKALGGTPVSVSTADLYMALDRKTIDGVITASQYLLAVKLNEVVKYCISEPLSVSTSVVAMNLNVWNKLPADIKVIIQDINEEIRYKFMEKQKTNAEYLTALAKAGIECSALSVKEKEKFRAALRPVTQEWIQKAEKNWGIGGSLVDEVKTILSQ